MEKTRLIIIGMLISLASVIAITYIGCGGSSSSSSSDDSGSSAQTDALGITDTDFGTLGVMTTTIGAYGNIERVMLQPDGKILTAGYANFSGDQFTLARYTITGTLDTTFGGGDGIVTSTIETECVATSLLLQPDGKIILGGRTNDGVKNSFALARYTITGTLDAGFGAGGITTTLIGTTSQIYSLALQTDDKIVACGESDNIIALARYTITGTLDTSFGISGVVTATIGATDVTANKLIIQSDGKIVIGSSSLISSTWTFALARYTITGTLDSGFGVNGVVTKTISGSDWLYTIAQQPDGKFLSGGYTWNGGSIYPHILMRYTAAGALDTAFGGGDGVITATIPAFDDIEIYDMALQSNGKIVTTGYASDTRSNIIVTRYNANGTLDTTFGGGDGFVIVSIGTNCQTGTVVVQPNGYIVVGGFITTNGVMSPALMRFK